jgi:predicted alpha/beta superfamily hydrolase
VRIASAFVVLSLVFGGVVGCDDSGEIPTGGSTGAGASTSASSSTSSVTTTSGSTSSGSTSTGMVSSLDDLLARLRANRDLTLQEESDKGGWPVLVTEGRVVVATNSSLQIAGDFNAWTPAALTADQGFGYAILPDVAGAKYKLVDGGTYGPDPWARAYAYDQNGEITQIAPTTPHLDRYFEKGDAKNAPRTVRVWVPEGGATSVLYAEDGQNLFDPDAFFGGWKLDQAAPAHMMIVAIDNTADRFQEYTQVTDQIQGQTIGGEADEYAAFLDGVVRPLVATHYGEPTKRGLIGSSLGGLVSLEIAYAYPSVYAFAASMSGTLGWGSIALSNPTIIQKYVAKGHQPTAIYLDSGGGGTCADTDGDGTMDDGDSTDNFCETNQMRDALAGLGYQFDVDLFHWHEAGATHDEAAWAARVFRPLQIFDGL